MMSMLYAMNTFTDDDAISTDRVPPNATLISTAVSVSISTNDLVLLIANEIVIVSIYSISCHVFVFFFSLVSQSPSTTFSVPSYPGTGYISNLHHHLSFFSFSSFYVYFLSIVFHQYPLQISQL